MHEHASTCIESSLNELVAVFEMLQQVFVVDIVDLYYLVLIVLEERFLQR